MSEGTLIRPLTWGEMKVFRNTTGATTATVTFSGTSRFAALVTTVKPAILTDYGGLYAVFGYGTSAAARRVETLVSAAEITITPTTGGFTVTASTATYFTIVVPIDLNDTASVVFS